MNKIASISTSFFMWMFLFFTITSAQAQFKVVLDAGHGGKDSGAYQNKVKEKDIVLDVVLRVGKILDEHKDIKQIYTRKTDVFIALKERANIANKADANLFVSVHCNSNVSPLPYGALTLVMGQGRSGLNFEVAKAENSVIFLEDNYKEQYKGFDPNKPESVIGLKILQEESLNRSVEVASNLQSIFEKELKRKNKGVHQQLLWVLDATYMPGVLVELGFISNGTEAKYLSSEKGKQEMAEALARAIVKYKNDYFAAEQTQTTTVDAENKSNVAAKKEDQEAPNKIIPKFNSEKKATVPEKKDEKTVEKPKTEPKKDTKPIEKVIKTETVKSEPKVIEKPKTEPIITEKNVKKEIEPVKVEPKKEEVTIAEKLAINTTNGVVIYKVQISATDRKFDLKPEFFKGLDKISVTFDQKLYRYYYEETTEYPKAQKYLEITRKKGYTSAFIVPFKNGEKITFQEAFNQK